MENFYVLYGVDKSLIEHELDRILEQLKIDDVVYYDMNTSDLSDVIEDATTVGMFSRQKVIIMENCSFLVANKSIDHLEELERYVEHYNPDNYCILLSYTEKIDTRKRINKLLSKHKVIELKKADKGYLSSYVEDYLKSNSYQMEDITYFLDKVGSNLCNIQNELDKLIMYKMDEKIIYNQDIDKISITSMEEEIFSLTDAIIARNTARSLDLLEEFLNKDYDEMQIVMLLASQFRFLFQVKRLLDKNKTEGEISKILEVNPYRVKFTVRKLYSYTEGMILKIIQRLAKIDHDVKLGIMDKRLALELFIIDNFE